MLNRRYINTYLFLLLNDSFAEKSKHYKINKNLLNKLDYFSMCTKQIILHKEEN